MITTAVILAGGKGERMLPITECQPKALVPIFGVPIIKCQIDQLIRLGIEKIFILTGHLGNQIEDYIYAQNYLTEVICIQSNSDLGPGERVVNSLEDLPQDFILLYCDNFIPNDDLIRAQIHTTDEISLILQRREKGNLRINISGNAEYVQEARSLDNPYVELGYISMRSGMFREILMESGNINLSLKAFSKQYKIGFVELKSNFQSVSDFERYISQGLQGKIVILDRDGILNKKMGPRKYLHSMDQLVYENHNVETFAKLGELGYNFVVASNQPGIATGEVSPAFLSELHQRMTSYLRDKGIHLLAFYVCNHHWDDMCECRKPKPGLLNKITLDFHLNAKETVFVGDEDKDVEAAESAGMKGIKFPSEKFLEYFQT